MKNTLISLFAIVGLSGCGVMQQYQYNQQQQAKVDTAKAQIAALNERCVGTLNSDPRLDPLRPYINFEGKSSIQQLASTKKPNAKEKQAILVYDEIVTQCFDEREKIFKAADAPYYLIQNTKEYSAAAKEAKANLWAGNYTYGQYLKVATQNFEKSESSRAAAAQTELQRQQQAQMQQAQINAVNAQAAAAVMSAQAQQQSANAQTMMMFNQAQQRQLAPVQTNCTRMGNSVNCQTY